MAVNSNCHIVVVAGGKGGVGKSVFAANLAFAFLREMRSKTLLIDLDNKSCGDQNIITGLRPQKTIAELCSLNSPINQSTIKQIVSHHQGGLDFIGAVHSPEQNLNAPAEIFKKQIHALSQFFQYIVVDAGCDIEALQYSAIECCNSILLVTTPEVLAVNQTKKIMSKLLTATVPIDYFQLVLNKVGKTGLTPQAITQNLRCPLVGIVPQDDLITYASLQRSTPFVLTNANAPITNAYHEVVRKLTGGILQRLKSKNQSQQLNLKSNESKPQISGQVDHNLKNEEEDPLTRLKIQIHNELIREMDLKKNLASTDGDPVKEKQLRDKTTKTISQLTDRYGAGLSRDERSKVIKEVLDEALGLGPLEDLLNDKAVSEIMVNGAKQIFIERSGKLQLSPIQFTTNQQLRNVIERIVTPLGRRIDEKTPYCDARLADGSRVNAIIEPLAIDGPAVTIRKFPTDRITIDHYTDRFFSLTKPMANFLRVCVEQGLNIIISGGTGSGKTTLLNVLSGFIPANERIITVEDAAELQLKQEHVVRLETRPPNMEGSGAITIRDLIRNSLRMRPDRIVVGECRDGAALDMLSAMNTGHDGSMATVHSNNPKEAMSRLETLCMMAGMDLPARAIREQIASAVNLVVQIKRFSDGSRKISSITEVVEFRGEGITLEEIFRFKEEGFDKNRKIIGQFQAMGRIPKFIESFEKRGVIVPRSLFSTSVKAGPNGFEGSNSAPSTVGSLKTGPKAAVQPSMSKTKKIPLKPTIKKTRKVSGGDE